MHQVEHKSAMCPCPEKARTHGILGCFKRSLANRLRNVVLPLSSALVRSHLKYCAQVWAPLYTRDMDVLERVQ